jgi:putative ATPase
LNSAARKLGHGEGYKNAHNYQNHYVKQQYLPDELVGRTYYEPTEMGREKNMKAWMEYIKKK